MSAHHHSTNVQRLFAFAVPVFIATWLISVPTLTWTSTSLAAVALFAALGRVAFTAHRDAMASPSLAPSLHDADRGGADHRRRRDRS